jgi:hypothetical protein
MIALVLDAVIAVAGIIIGPGFNLTGMLAVGPLLACARCNGRMTALVAGYALALCFMVAGVTWTIAWPRRWPCPTWTRRSSAWSGSCSSTPATG